MAKSQGERFTEEQQVLADIAKALSHPARIAILEVLAARNVCVCGELVSELPLSQATVSQHLKVLKAAGLICGSVEGPKTCYCVDWEGLSKAGSLFSKWFGQIELLKSSCC